MAHTKESLKHQLADMGLKPTDSLMLHSSMKAIGDVEGRADAVVDAFMEYFADGLFMTPTHTWKQMGPDHDVFDPAVEESCVGVITNIFMRRPGVFRSLHPTHSIAAWGPSAEEYVKGDENFHTPCDPQGCFGRLRGIGAKILLAGVTHIKNTYIHSVEESFDVPQRFTAEPVPFGVVMPDGSIRRVEMYRHYNPIMAHISESFDKLKDEFFKRGVALPARLGDAECILCDAAGLYDVTGEFLSRDPYFFIERFEG